MVMRMMTMRTFLPALVTSAILALGACASDPAAPDESSLFAADDVVDLVPDFALSSAAAIDGAGMGGTGLPDELQLTPEQKAEITALREAFHAAHQDEVAALRDLERQIRDLRRQRGGRAAILELLVQARGIIQGLEGDFAVLQEAVWAVYTDEQRAWIDAHRPKICRPGDRPRLTEEQIAQIRALHQAFQEAMADEIRAIKEAHQAARLAHQNGALREEIAAILAEVADEIAALREAERRLQAAIQDVLSDDQRRDWCLVRQRVAP
jgi:Spy/CpxP family protein refolding chaperone